MAKKSKDRKSTKSKGTKSTKSKRSKPSDAALKRKTATKQQRKKDGKVAAKQAERMKTAAETATTTKPDQVEVLKLALRATEAKLVDAEHRLREVQQRLDDERRALAAAAEEAVVDAAVAETVAEAVADAALVAGDGSPAVVAEVVAESLQGVADAADPAAALAGPQPAAALTPPLPGEPAPEQPSEEWTLVRLREEAHRRGLTGTSNLSKARLVERLTAS